MLLFCFVVGSLFSFCKKESNQGPVNKSSSTESFKNSPNPYDSVGIIHNDACRYALKILIDDGCVLTDGETDTIVTFQSFLSKDYDNEKWKINIHSIVSLIDDYLYLNEYASSETALSDIFDEDYIKIVQGSTALNDSSAFFTYATSSLGIPLNSEFLSESARLIYNGNSSLSFCYSQSKDIESTIITQLSNEDIMQLIGLSVFRHSTHFWNDENNPFHETAAPPWVASDLMGAMTAWGYGAGFGGWLGWGIIAGYAALCSTVAALA